MENIVKILFAFLVGFVFTACGIKSTYTGKSADEITAFYSECHNKELDRIDRQKFCDELYLKILPVLDEYCDVNEAQACFEVGELLMMDSSPSTRGNPPFTLSAIAAYDKACDLGLKKACEEPHSQKIS